MCSSDLLRSDVGQIGAVKMPIPVEYAFQKAPHVVADQLPVIDKEGRDGAARFSEPVNDALRPYLAGHCLAIYSITQECCMMQ